MRAIVDQLSQPMPKGQARMHLAIDRFNRVCGLDGWGYTVKVLHQRAGQLKGGGAAYDITVGAQIWVGDPTVFRMGFGGDIGGVQSTVLQSATSAAFLNAAAMFGVGREWLEWDNGTENQAHQSAPVVLPGINGTLPAAPMSQGGLEEIFAVPSSMVLQSFESPASPAPPLSPAAPAPADREAGKRMAAEDGAPPGASPPPARPQVPMMSTEQGTKIRELCAITGNDSTTFFSVPRTQAQAAQVIASLQSRANSLTGPGASFGPGAVR